jgi:hypothetical protein
MHRELDDDVWEVDDEALPIPPPTTLPSPLNISDESASSTSERTAIDGGERRHHPPTLHQTLEMLEHPGGPRFVIVDVRNGLGNRLRALASAMSVAASLHRPVLVVWQPDLHCNCSFLSLFRSSLPFLLLEVEVPADRLSKQWFQVYNYMRPEPGAVKDERVDVDPSRHLYFKSAFVMNHPRGNWKFAQRYLQPPLFPRPLDAIERMVIADRTMVGLHVRNIFDAPRDASSSAATLGTAALEGARKQYGESGASALLEWRGASHWTNFVGKMTEMQRQAAAASEPPLRFYLAADSADAYAGLSAKFGNALLYTRRECGGAERCDFRDCDSMVYSLADMLNLARTRLILGSGYSSYSEVASRLGSSLGRALPILMAGKDFGEVIVDSGHGEKHLPVGRRGRTTAT